MVAGPIPATPTTVSRGLFRPRLFRYTASIMALEYAKRMRIIIIAIVFTVVIALLSGIAFVIFYDVPTCTDRKQNQDEVGVDCGGSCTYLCTSQVRAPNVKFVRALMPQKGRVDVIAYIENQNSNAGAKDAPYTIELYGADGSKVGTTRGVVDIAPRAIVPLFIPAATQGSVVSTAFLTFGDIQWQTQEPAPDAVRVEDAQLSDGQLPRITATIQNPAFDPVYNVEVVATVFDADDVAIAASRTVIPGIKARASVPVTFTWNAPFSRPASYIEVKPVTALP